MFVLLKSKLFLGGSECVPLQYFKWKSRRCLPLPPRCEKDEDCLRGVEVCREYFRNGRHDLRDLTNHKFFR